jgi:IS605 OrfB family transposase
MEFLRRKGKYYCHITFEPEFPTGKGTKELGILGIDVNPDGIAITIIFPDGNYKYHEFIKCPEMLTASTNKRNYLAGDLAHRIVKIALRFGVAIAVEDLKFNNQGVDSGKKFNRLKHNFAYRKMLEAIESASLKHGVELIKVDPAYTSKIGLYKYCPQYGMDIHNGAAMVIARRAYGYKEKVPKYLAKRCVRPEELNDFYKQDTKTKYGQISGVITALMSQDETLDKDVRNKPNGYIKHRKKFLNINRYQNKEVKELNDKAKSDRIKKLNKNKKKNLRLNKSKLAVKQVEESKNSK